MATKPKTTRPTDEDQYGVGMNEDGTVNVLTPEAYAKALIARKAEEEVEADADFMEEDASQ